MQHLLWLYLPKTKDLKEALLDYREKLTMLEQEYSGKVANNKNSSNIATTENGAAMAANRGSANNSTASFTPPSTVPSKDGLYYFPNSTVDIYGRQLPAGSYIRVQNGTEYAVLPGDPRIPERIEAEYQAQEAAKQQPQQQVSPQSGAASTGTEPTAGIQAGVNNGSQQPQTPVGEEAVSNGDTDWEEEPTADTDKSVVDKSKLSDTDIISFTYENGCDYAFYKSGERVDIIDRETGKVLATLEKGKDFFYDEDGMPYFSKEFLESKEYSQILFDRYAGGEMDIINFAKSIGCEYKFYATYAELTDPQTGEVLMRLQKNKDYFYDKDGLPYLSMDVLFSDEYGELLDRQRVSAKSSEKDIVSFVEEYNCKYRFHNGKADLLDPQTGKVIMTLTEGKDYFFGTDGLPYLSKEFISKLNSKDARGLTAQDLLERSPQTIAKLQVFEYAERILRGDEDVTQEDLDTLAENLALLEGDKKVEAALEELFNDEQFAAAWEERLKELDALENPQTEEDEATAVEMVFATVLQFTLGYTHETGNKVFDSALKLVSFGLMLSPIGKFQNIVKGTIGKAVLKKALVWAANQFAKKEMRVNVERKIMQFVAAVGLGDKIYKGFDDIVTFIYGSYNIFDIPLPKGMEDFLNELYDMLGMELEAEVLK